MRYVLMIMSMLAVLGPSFAEAQGRWQVSEEIDEMTDEKAVKANLIADEARAGIGFICTSDGVLSGYFYTLDILNSQYSASDNAKYVRADLRINKQPMHSFKMYVGDGYQRAYFFNWHAGTVNKMFDSTRTLKTFLKPGIEVLRVRLPLVPGTEVFHFTFENAGTKKALTQVLNHCKGKK